MMEPTHHPSDRYTELNYTGGCECKVHIVLLLPFAFFFLVVVVFFSQKLLRIFTQLLIIQYYVLTCFSLRHENFLQSLVMIILCLV